MKFTFIERKKAFDRRKPRRPPGAQSPDDVGRPDNSEHYLWIYDRDKQGGTIRDRGRLYELQKGAAPNNETEQLLADNPEWLRIYFRHVIDEWTIAIPEGGPLTKWSKTWIGVLEDEERLEAGLDISNNVE